MAEYIKREAAVDAVRRLRIGLRHDGFYKEDLICVEILTRLESIPAADVVEVVRCGECKMANSCSNDRVVYCTMTHTYKPSNFFCADGAKMEGDGE